MPRKVGAALAVIGALIVSSANAVTVTVGIGTQNTTTNTVTGGIVIEKLGLLDKYLAELKKTPKYKNIDFKLDWQNFTSGPPVTNGMVANKLQIGMMGDYPLLVNGATFQASPETRSELIALILYNLNGAGNGMVVHKDSPYYQLSDLKGKKVSVPFGSAAHALSHEISNLRKEAVVALGEIGDSAAIPALEQALDDSDPDVRKLARLALIQLSK